MVPAFSVNDTATTAISTLSLHDALPIYASARVPTRPGPSGARLYVEPVVQFTLSTLAIDVEEDRKSTRLNSSHITISYAVFCLKKKKNANLTASYRIRFHCHRGHSTILR